MTIQYPLPAQTSLPPHNVPLDAPLEQEIYHRFRRALRSADQAALDDLLASARQHLPAVSRAAQLLPFEALLLALVLEQHKEIHRLSVRLEQLLQGEDE